MTKEIAIHNLYALKQRTRALSNHEALDMAIKALETQPCEDCVSRKLLSDNICEGISCNECSFNEIDGKSGCLLQKRFDELPSVTPKYTDEEIDRAQAAEQAYIDKMVELRVDELKRPKGKWIDIEYFDRDYGEWICYRPKCPFCNEEPKEYSNYCPQCGAKLREEEPDY